jgi:dipeptide transport system ATP-binding protein
VGDQIAEVLRAHLGLRGAARASARWSCWTRSRSRMRAAACAYPHQLSGGMNQRVMIAMAVACQPRLLIADEPTTALDVTIQARSWTCCAGCRRAGHGPDLITHDLGVVAELAQRVAVMYAGQIIETGPADAVRPAASPLHRGPAGGAARAQPRPGLPAGLAAAPAPIDRWGCVCAALRRGPGRPPGRPARLARRGALPASLGAQDEEATA